MKSLSYLNKYFIKYKWRFIFGIVFTIASNYFGVKMPVYVKDAVNHIIETIGIKQQSFYDILLLAGKIGGIYVLLFIGKGFFLFLMRQTIIIMSRLIEYDLKNEIFQKYLNLDYSFYKKSNTGDLMNRISEDVSQVRQYLGPGIMYSINLTVMFVMAIAQMVLISPSLTLYVLLPLPIMSLIIYKVSKMMNNLSLEVQKEQSWMSTLAQETFSGIRVVKAYNREFETHQKFNKSTEDYKNKNLKLVKVNALFMPTILFLIGLSNIIVIYLGGKMAIQNQITIGDILAFIFYVNMLTWPFVSIGWVTAIIQRAAASQERINQFLKIEPTIINTNNETFDFKGKIEFKNVSYTYPNTGIQAIKNLSFTIHPNDTFAIIGNTGSGKSTILNLLMRNIDPDEGEILIDNHKISDINLNSFRNQTGVVPQEVFLFSDTIANNISFGLEENTLTQSELIQIAQKVHVWHNIKNFPLQFNTLLGERGVNLSGGQKQRISIARALIRKPKLLILDDCLSAVDTETEEIILKNIKNEEQASTTIVVSHRVSSLRNANKIIVLEEGEKIEEGSHDELLSKKGIYFEIFQQQLSENKN